MKLGKNFFKRLKEEQSKGFRVLCLDESEYKNPTTPINCKCNVCNSTFMIQPQTLIVSMDKGRLGCPDCTKLMLSEKYRTPLSALKERIYDNHGDYYNYPHLEQEYVNRKSKITIICPKHGQFSQTMDGHINSKQGCKKCSIEKKKYTLEGLIEAFKNVHPSMFYDYSKVEYTEEMNAHSKVTIICPIHGEFSQQVATHLRKHGCPSCASNNGGVSYKALTWLDHVAGKENINILHAANGGEYKLPEANIRVDGYCKETNTVYEFHGDLFHGNINRYDPDSKLNPFTPDSTMQELYDKTKAREQEIIDFGYNLVVIWESEYDELQIPLKRYDGIISLGGNKPLPEDLDQLQIELMDEKYTTCSAHHNWKCKICDKEFARTLSHQRMRYRTKGWIGCSNNCTKLYRGERIERLGESFFTKLEKANSEGFNVFVIDESEYINQNTHIGVRCTTCGTEYTQKPVSILRAINAGTVGCRVCQYESMRT